MKKKLTSLFLLSFVSLLPLPFIFDYSFIAAGAYICFVLLLASGLWSAMNTGAKNEK